MQALGIMGSPRRTGNTSILPQEIMQILARDLYTEIVNIADFKIEPCISCYSCLESGQCCLQDEMFYDRLLAADAIIIASPAYFGSVPGPLKIAMDRTWCLRGRLAGKVGGVGRCREAVYREYINHAEHLLPPSRHDIELPRRDRLRRESGRDMAGPGRLPGWSSPG